jgi:hypothetical protein
MKSKVPELMVTSPTDEEKTTDEARDYADFLEKARKEEEKKEKEQAKKIKRARETNMSPWASRM